jgi:hypothetical protein
MPLQPRLNEPPEQQLSRLKEGRRNGRGSTRMKRIDADKEASRAELWHAIEVHPIREHPPNPRSSASHS